MSNIIRVQKNKENPYVMINKNPLHDNRLSWKAKGILAYLLSKPDNWKAVVADIVKQSKDGRDSVYAGLKELKTFGYMEKYPVRDSEGRITHWESVIYEVPLTENPEEVENTKSKPLTENPYEEKPYKEKPERNNNDFNNNDFNNNQSVIEDRQTDIEKEKETIIEQAQVDLYKGDHRELLETTIDTLLRLKEIKVNNKLLNNKQIREQLNKLNINICDFVFNKFRKAQSEKEIKNRARYFQVLLLSCIEEYSANNIID